jgi:uncharacterized protein YecT (DUF1311 family)
MAELRIPIIAELKGKRAFNEAESSVKSLSKAVRALGIGLSATAVANFGKQSLKAFIADELAATRLTKAVDNLGMSFANPFIADYIQKMEQATKVADDELRPAFQALLQQTGSITKSQAILGTAIEVSRGSTVGLSEVVNDLNKAYIGNTKGLRKYNLGLDATTLKATSFEKVQEMLNKQFAGSNTAYLETYAGGVSLLSLAWGNLQETTGGALLSMASFGSGDQAKGMTNLANILDRIGQAVTLISKGFNTVTGLLNLTDMKNGLLAGFNPYRRPSGDKEDKVQKKSLDTYAELLKKIEDERKKNNAFLIKNQKALTAEQKKTLALQKASKVLNLDAIGIEAALKGKISETDRLSLLLQKALLAENTGLATQLSDQLEAAIKRQNDIRNLLLTTPEAPNPYRNWTLPQDLLNYTASSLGVSVAQLQTAPIPITSSMTDAQMELAAAVNANQTAEAKVINVAVYLGDTEITGAVTSVQQNQSLSGTFSDVSRYNGRGAPSVK